MSSSAASEPTVVAGGAELVVREWGGPAGTPLLFWHGLGLWGALQLGEAGPAWAARGFRVLAPAAPGLGDSPPLGGPEDYRPSRLADLAVALADGLALDRFAYVGFSWGGSIGVHLATRHPERLTALALLDGGQGDVDAAEPLEALERSFAEEHASIRYPTWEAFLEERHGRAAAWRPALEERYRAGMREVDGWIVPRADPRAAAWALAGVAAEPPTATHAALGSLDLPVLLLATKRPGGDLERFRAAVPQAEVHVFDGGHDVLAERPDETIELVAAWLASAALGGG